MNTRDTANVFGQMAEKQTADAREYIGRTMREDAQTWTLDSINYAGVLYWRKGKNSKKLYVIGGYTTKDLPAIFREKSPVNPHSVG